MLKRGQAIIAAAVVSALGISAAQATVLYSENFDTDHTANWQYNTSISGDTASQADFGGAANFFFDYSTVGIPSAPGAGGTTLGMQLQANLNGTNGGTGIFSAISASPLGVTLPSVYTLTFSAWQNTLGPFPGGGTGSTQLTKATVGVTGTNDEFAGGTLTGVQFSASGDGGSSQDYRTYSALFPHGAGGVLQPADGVYYAGTQSTAQQNTDPHYASFGSLTPPAAQTALDPFEQTGTTAVGTQGFAWHTWVITKTATDINWSVDGVNIADVPASLFPASFGGNDIGFGQTDINTGTVGANGNTYQFGLVDNISVSDAVPEPATLGLLSLAGLGLLRRRRNA